MVAILAVLVCATLVTAVYMVVVVGVDGGRSTKYSQVRRVVADLLRHSLAADMAVQADHLMAGRHHHMEIVGDH